MVLLVAYVSHFKATHNKASISVTCAYLKLKAKYSVLFSILMKISNVAFDIFKKFPVKVLKCQR